MKTFAVMIAVTGFAGVAAGAFGAHALESRLATAGMTGVWETAVFYHLLHTVAWLAVALAVVWGPANTPRAVLQRAGVAWGVGILLFSGSLYWLALGGPRWIGPVTPLGGLALMVGWILVGIALFRAPRIS
jgi:uncharacterized membrane protein YgdD (TMEM256/DUF423 family)